MFGKPSASSFSGNILRNVETGRVLPCAPVSIFRRNLWMPFRFGNLMLMSTKASSLWIILIQLNVRFSLCFLSFFVVVYCISFHVLFSPMLWLIVRFCFLCSLLCDLGLCFDFVPFDKHTDAQWFLYHMCCILIRMLDKPHGENQGFYHI